MNDSNIIIKDYGIMILKKNSILYHTSETKLINLKEKPFLFCSFHPYDYESYNSKYKIKLQ